MAKKTHIDKTRCTACGVCNAIAPDYFDWDDDGLMVEIQSEVAAEDEELVEEAVESCPAQAISLK